MKNYVRAAMVAAGLLVTGMALGAAGMYTNGLTGANVVGVVTGLTNSPVLSAVPSRATIPVDTGLANGQQPQTVSATNWQLSAISMELIKNQTTAASGTASLTTNGGMITTDSLSLAPGASYTLTISDPVILVGTGVALPQVTAYNGSNTAVGSRVEVTSVVVSAGQAVVTLTNVGSVTLNGTLLVAFHI